MKMLLPLSGPRIDGLCVRSHQTAVDNRDALGVEPFVRVIMIPVEVCTMTASVHVLASYEHSYGSSTR